MGKVIKWIMGQIEKSVFTYFEADTMGCILPPALPITANIQT